MAETTKNTKYYSALAAYVDKVMRVKKTPKGKLTTRFNSRLIISKASSTFKNGLQIVMQQM